MFKKVDPRKAAKSRALPPDPGVRPQAASRQSGGSGLAPGNSLSGEIAEWLRALKFRRRLFGGVDERDVWRRIEELNRLYEKAIVAERARCEALLMQRGMASRQQGARVPPEAQQATARVQVPPIRPPRPLRMPPDGRAR